MSEFDFDESIRTMNLSMKTIVIKRTDTYSETTVDQLTVVKISNWSVKMKMYEGETVISLRMGLQVINKQYSENEKGVKTLLSFY